MWLWFKVGLFLFLVAALLWDGISSTGEITALPLWYFGAAPVAAFMAALGFLLVDQATPQRPRWRRLIFKWSSFALILMILSAPRKALQLGEYTGAEFAGRFFASWFIPTLIFLALLGVAVLMEGTRE